ncbi:MAG: VOC family protein [Chloroflexi bacterium]|nr:VOC family protein [Chloroflexota bacterium]MDA1004291.1 VOC family protein [Chloroflexota bacterium]MQC28126.1 glyoxalase [Chloroflexota bacterium]
MTDGNGTKSPIIPTLRYRDAARMVDWLCDAFGFERHLVVPDGSGGIATAQLTFGSGMIMLASWRGDAFGVLILTPADAGSVQIAYVIVADVDAHAARAEAHGTEVVLAPQNQDYGGRDYTVRDPEGQIWSFGSEDPWA